MKKIVCLLAMAVTIAQGQNLCGTKSEEVSRLRAKVLEGTVESRTGECIAQEDEGIPLDVTLVERFVLHGDLYSETFVDRILPMVDLLNEAFEGTGLHFYLYRYRESFLNGGNRLPNSINGSLPDREGTIRIDFQDLFPFDEACGYSATAPLSGYHLITLNTTHSYCMVGIERTLIHEMGHYFGLFHTHEFAGTDQAEYVSRDKTGSESCEFLGDGFCDTPADPNLLGKIHGACVYDEDATDRDGARFTPDTTNVMSYAPVGCKVGFSQEQKNFMRKVSEKVLCQAGASEPIRLHAVGAYPNPFSTEITITLPRHSYGARIFDAQGRLIKSIVLRDLSIHDTYEIVWNGRSEQGLDIPSGVYFVQPLMADQKKPSKNAKTKAIRIVKSE